MAATPLLLLLLLVGCVCGHQGVWIQGRTGHGALNTTLGTSRSQCEKLCNREPRCVAARHENKVCLLQRHFTEPWPAKRKVEGSSMYVKTLVVSSYLCFGTRAKGNWFSGMQLPKRAFLNPQTIKVRCGKACAVRCDKKPECVAVAFINQGSNNLVIDCTMYSLNGFADSKYWTVSVKSAHPSHNLYLKSELGPVKKGFLIPSARMSGWYKSSVQPNQRACADKCSDDSGCHAATFIPSHRGCYLHQNARPRKPLNLTAGVSSYVILKTQGLDDCSEIRGRGYWFPQMKVVNVSAKAEKENVACHDECARLCDKESWCRVADYRYPRADGSPSSCSLYDTYSEKNAVDDQWFTMYVKVDYEKLQKKPNGGQTKTPKRKETCVSYAKKCASDIVKYNLLGAEAADKFCKRYGNDNVQKREYCDVKTAHPYSCSELWLSTEYGPKNERSCREICDFRGSECSAYHYNGYLCVLMKKTCPELNKKGDKEEKVTVKVVC